MLNLICLQIAKVYQKSELKAGLKSCTIEKFDTSHDTSELIVFFRLHLDRRKLPRYTFYYNLNETNCIKSINKMIF